MQKKVAADSKTSKAIEVEFGKLKPGRRANARVTGQEEGLGELEASIRAKGLLQPLVVRTAKGGGYEVTAGNRRLASIGRLIEKGHWQGPVPVRVREESDEEALDTSLAENVVRLPMHPIDQFEAFERLREDLDLSAADIAQRYGIPERTVRQRLALGSLAPEIRKAWRENRIDADTAEAFAIARDKKLQASTFAALKKRGGPNAHQVRQALIKDRPRIDDERVAFVGLEAYRAAGGEVVESLFENDGYLGDGALLERLAQEKLEEICERLVEDGWSFAVTAEQAGTDLYSWGRSQPLQNGKATPQEKKRLTTIEAELKQIAKRAKRQVYGSNADDYDRQEALESEAEVLRETIEARGFTAAQKARSGCVVNLNGDRADITFGLLRDMKSKKLARADGGERKGRPGDGAPIIPNALLVDLGALQTQAAAHALAHTPDVAIAVAAAGMCSKFDAWGVGNSPVRLKPDGMRTAAVHDGDDEDDEDADEDLDDDALLDGKAEAGPRSSGFAAQLAIAQAAPARALALALGRALDLRQIKFKPVAKADVDALISALPGQLYLAKVRELLSLEDYFKRAPAAIAIAAIAEMGGTPQKSAKKSELALSAAANGRDCGWLPMELRHPDYKLARRIGDPEHVVPTKAPARGKRKCK